MLSPFAVVGCRIAPYVHPRSFSEDPYHICFREKLIPPGRFVAATRLQLLLFISTRVFPFCPTSIYRRWRVQVCRSSSSANPAFSCIKYLYLAYIDAAFMAGFNTLLLAPPPLAFGFRMMYGFGDDEHPLPETVACMQQVR